MGAPIVTTPPGAPKLAMLEFQATSLIPLDQLRVVLSQVPLPPLGMSGVCCGSHANWAKAALLPMPKPAIAAARIKALPRRALRMSHLRTIYEDKVAVHPFKPRSISRD